MILPEEHVALTCKKHGLIAELIYQILWFPSAKTAEYWFLSYVTSATKQ